MTFDYAVAAQSNAISFDQTIHYFVLSIERTSFTLTLRLKFFVLFLV